MCSTSKVDRLSNHSLIDHGANWGVSGEDVRVQFYHPDRRVDIRGIDNHEINSIKIVKAEEVTSTTLGEVIIIMHQHAYYSKGNTINSSGKVEYFKNFVDDKSIEVGDKKHTLTNDNYTIPITIKNSLPYIALRPCTDE